MNLQLPLLASLLRLLTITTSTTTRAISAALVVRTPIASQWEASPRVLVRRDSLGSRGTVVQTPSTAVSELLRAVLRRTGRAAPPIMCAFATFAFRFYNSSAFFSSHCCDRRDVAVIRNVLLESVASRTRRSHPRARRCASRSASTTRTVSPESTARRTSAGPAVGATPTAHSARLDNETNEFQRLGFFQNFQNFVHLTPADLRGWAFGKYAGMRGGLQLQQRLPY